MPSPACFNDSLLAGGDVDMGKGLDDEDGPAESISQRDRAFALDGGKGHDSLWLPDKPQGGKAKLQEMLRNDRFRPSMR